MSTFPRSLKTLIASNVRAYLAADASLLAFFGAAGIRTREYAESGAPTSLPYLTVVPGQLVDLPTTREGAKARFEVDLAVYLPRLAPADDSLAVPTVPSAADGGTGLLTVTRRYCATYYTATGESFACELSAPITVTGKKVALTVSTGPAGTVGRRLWATRTNRTCARFLDVIPDNSTTTYVDETPDAYLGDEIAPYPGLYGDLMEQAKAVLWANRTLETLVPTATHIQLVDSIAAFKDEKPVIDQQNRLLWQTTVAYSLFYSMSARQSLIET